MPVIAAETWRYINSYIIIIIIIIIQTCVACADVAAAVAAASAAATESGLTAKMWHHPDELSVTR